MVDPGQLAFLAVGLGAGVVSGLFGLGGGVVVVPVLTALGASMPEAVGTSVVVVLANSIAGTAQHARQGNVLWRLGLGMAVSAVPVALAASYAAALIPQRVLAVGFVVMLATGGLLLVRRASVRERGAASRRNVLGGIVTGGLGGALAGLFGVGGGAFIVPLQVILLGVRMRRAVGTCLLVIVISAAAAVVMHAIQGHVEWLTAAWIAVGGVVGAPIGARVAQRLGDDRLRVAFVVLLLGLAALMLIESY